MSENTKDDKDISKKESFIKISLAAKLKERKGYKKKMLQAQTVGNLNHPVFFNNHHNQGDELWGNDRARTLPSVLPAGSVVHTES